MLFYLLLELQEKNSCQSFTVGSSLALKEVENHAKTEKIEQVIMYTNCKLATPFQVSKHFHFKLLSNIFTIFWAVF